MKYRHPDLSGQIHEASPVDEIDVSRCARLGDTFLDAQPSQDSSFQEVLVDGSTITITNHLMNGSLTLQVVSTTGLVGTGDLIAAAHFIIASKDSTGGTFTVIRFINGKRIVRIYWGVSWKNVPHQKIAGNSVVVYPIVMLYAGWVEGLSESEATEKVLWAVGNKYGLKGRYKPYSIQEAEDPTGNNFYSGNPFTSADSGRPDIYDDAIGPVNIDEAVVPSPLPQGLADDPVLHPPGP